MESSVGGGEMSRAMINIITKDTTKEEMRESYKDYPDTQPKGFEPFHASTVEPMFCEIPKGSRVLDIGCNSGEMMVLLRDSKECSVVGVDISETVLELARQKGLEVFNADAETLPFEDASFDVAILREVLVHLHDPVRALKEIRRVLKPSGFLLGSAPHANLERQVWDDKRLHHRYYDEQTLLADLDQAFQKTHLKVLNGAQFSVGFASSSLGDKPAELLWKSGNADVQDWETALVTDKKTLRVWMGPTQTTGGVYYRMIGYAMKMREMADTEIAFENFSFKTNDGCSSWQDKLRMNKDGHPVSALALHHFESCLKVADPWVFQLTYHDDILALFELLKQVYPKKKFITEVDDWLFDVPPYNIASNPYKPNSEKEQIAWDQLTLSDALIVSTSFLKDSLAELFTGKPIYVIPNSIDFDRWDNAKSDGETEAKKEGVVRIGYSGCANHSGDMEIVKPVLLALLDEFPNLEVIIAQDMGAFADITHPRFRVLKRWSNIIDYPSMMKGWDLDIGIAPLRDNNFNRAKSNLRWLEYSALKIPTVASRVRPFVESITHRSDGLICATKRDWYECLKTLIEGKNARETLGQNAYDSVKERFNMDRVAEQYRATLEDIKHGR
jgi:SAM-dependent methyltransferase/glycosyltransferase involved in cell wall biosynthesis